MLGCDFRENKKKCIALYVGIKIGKKKLRNILMI